MPKFWRILIVVLHYLWIGLFVYLGIWFLYNMILVSKKIEIPYIPFWLVIGIIVLNIPYYIYRDKIKKEKMDE